MHIHYLQCIHERYGILIQWSTYLSKGCFLKCSIIFSRPSKEPRVINSLEKSPSNSIHVIGKLDKYALAGEVGVIGEIGVSSIFYVFLVSFTLAR